MIFTNMCGVLTAQEGLIRPQSWKYQQSRGTGMFKSDKCVSFTFVCYVVSCSKKLYCTDGPSGAKK